MHDILIRTTDKHPLVAAASETAAQRGDILAIQKKGWKYSDYERNHPNWLIIRVVGLSKQDIVDLMEGGRPDEPQWLRRIGINVDGLVAKQSLTRDELFGRAF